jgi:tetratricopeptide (TPR) repeat protein
LSAYQRAATAAPDSSLLAEKIAAARARREAAVAACNTDGGDSALRACDSALVRGADDEFAIHKRKAILLQSANQPSPALDSYIAAHLLRASDKAVALGIVTLSESTGRKDALTLAARGSALLALGRAIDALTPLKQALALAPGLTQVQAQLATAERLATAEARRRIAMTQAQSAATTKAAVVTSSSLSANAPPRRYSNAGPPTRSH